MGDKSFMGEAAMSEETNEQEYLTWWKLLVRSCHGVAQPGPERETLSFGLSEMLTGSPLNSFLSAQTTLVWDIAVGEGLIISRLACGL